MHLSELNIEARHLAQFYIIFCSLKKETLVEIVKGVSIKTQLPSPRPHLFKVDLQCLWYTFHPLMNKNWNSFDSFLPSSFTQICYYFNDGDFECDIPNGVATIWEGEVAGCSLPWVINQLEGWGQVLIRDYKNPPSLYKMAHWKQITSPVLTLWVHRLKKLNSLQVIFSSQVETNRMFKGSLGSKKSLGLWLNASISGCSRHLPDPKIYYVFIDTNGFQSVATAVCIMIEVESIGSWCVLIVVKYLVV